MAAVMQMGSGSGNKGKTRNKKNSILNSLLFILRLYSGNYFVLLALRVWQAVTMEPYILVALY